MLKHNIIKHISNSLDKFVQQNLPRLIRSLCHISLYELHKHRNRRQFVSSLSFIVRGNFLVNSLQCFYVFQAHKTCILHRLALNTPC